MTNLNVSHVIGAVCLLLSLSFTYQLVRASTATEVVVSLLSLGACLGLAIYFLRRARRERSESSAAAAELDGQG